MSTISPMFDPSALLCGEKRPIHRAITVAAGANAAGAVAPRGLLLGRVTTTDKYVPCVKTASDGSQTPVAILSGDLDASSADANGPAYFEGEFAYEKMTVDPSWTLDSLRAALRAAASNLYVRSLGALG